MAPKFWRKISPAFHFFTRNSVSAILASILTQLHSPSRYSLAHRLWRLYLYIFIIRMAIFGYAIKKKLTWYFTWDRTLTGGLANSPAMEHGELVTISVIFDAFILFVDSLLYERPDGYVWPLVHDWVVENPRNFYTLNSQLNEPKLKILNPIVSYRSIKLFLTQITHFKLNFSSAQLPNYQPAISSVIRGQAILLSSLLQYGIEAMLTGLRTMIILSILGGTLQFKTLFNPNILVFSILVLDFSLISFRLLYAVRLLLFLNYSKVLVAFVECRHLKNLNLGLGKLVKSNSNGFWWTLRTFYRQHALIGYDLQQSNARIVSKVLFTAMLSNLPFNIFMMSILVLVSYPLSQKIFDVAVVLMQFAIVLISVQPMIYLSNLYHASGSTLMSFHLGSLDQNVSIASNLKNKLKLANYSELVYTNFRLTYTVGPVGAICYPTLFKFGIVYLGYFFTTAKLLFD